MSFEAKYDGWCADCDDRIRVGDVVTYGDHEVVHADCAESQRPARPVEVCNRCWLTKPCDCEDE